MRRIVPVLLAILLLAGCGKETAQPTQPTQAPEESRPPVVMDTALPQDITDITLTVPADMAKAAAGAHYTLMIYRPTMDAYSPLLYRVPATVGADGSIHVTQSCYAVADDWNSYLPLTAYYQADTKQYEAVCSLSLMGSFSVMEQLDFVVEEGDFARDSAQYYNCITCNALLYEMGLDAGGNVLPFKQWQTTDGIYFPQMSYQGALRMEKIALSGVKEELHCLIVLEDSQGNAIYTQMEKIKDAEAETPTATVKTEKGEMTFALYEKYCVLQSYTGEDTQVVIPDTLEGKPVTGIADRVFASCKNLTQVTLPAQLEQVGDSVLRSTPVGELALPETLRRIGSMAFSDTALTAVTLPENLEFLGWGAFCECSQLKNLESRSDCYVSAEGVLFSRDQKTLLAFPAGRLDHYDIPTGTVEIAPYAFSMARELTGITFPLGLERVSAYAFYGVDGLEGIVFPDTLKYLGAEAFGDVIEFMDAYEPVELDEIYLGNSVDFVGQGALNGLRFASIQADGKYFSIDGALYTHEGKTLVCVPNRWIGEFRIPEAVTTIASGAFNGCNNVTRVTGSANVTEISALPYDAEVCAPAGSALEQWALENERVFVKIEG